MPQQDHTYREGQPSADGPILLLSVAGQDEAKAGRPAAGRARDHLDAILMRVHATRPDLLPSPVADAYPILNAHPGVEYMELTERTEAPLAEYLEAANLARVVERVAGRDVIAFGQRARRTCRAAGIIPLMTGRHPSSLNRIPNARAGGDTPAERAARRYDAAANDMLASLAGTKAAASTSRTRPLHDPAVTGNIAADERT